MDFVGKAEYALDRKRVPIPPAYRAAFQPSGYVTTGTGPYLVLHTSESWVRESAIIRALPLESEDGADIHRDFFGNAATIVPDGQGRVQLSDAHISHALLERDVVVVGVGARLEVWDKGTYEAREAARREARMATIGRVPFGSPAGGG